MNRSIDLTSTVVAIREQVSAEVGDEGVLLNLKDGVYYGLNAVGASVWKLIQQPRTVRALREAVVNEYDVDPEQCERDLLALLNDLAARGLIEVSGGRPGQDA
jgi:sulfur transfer complex TusBCD TusB component (DsrH family)